MTGRRITDLEKIDVIEGVDELLIIDKNDTSAGPLGTDKRATIGQVGDILQPFVDSAGEEADRAEVAANQAEQAVANGIEAGVSQVTGFATMEANRAREAASDAEASAEQAAINASAIYPSVAQGLAETSDGEFFKVPEGTWLQLYRNDDGVAFPVMRLASQDELERLNTRLDPMLTSLLFS